MQCLRFLVRHANVIIRIDACATDHGYSRHSLMVMSIGMDVELPIIIPHNAMTHVPHLHHWRRSWSRGYVDSKSHSHSHW